MKDAGPFSTFKEAVADFMPRMREMVSSGAATTYAINEACFIIMKDGERRSFPMGFYHVRDYAHELGLTDNEGNLLPEAPEPSDQRVRAKFLI